MGRHLLQSQSYSGNSGNHLHTLLAVLEREHVAGQPVILHRAWVGEAQCTQSIAKASCSSIVVTGSLSALVKTDASFTSRRPWNRGKRADTEDAPNLMQG